MTIDDGSGAFLYIDSLKATAEIAGKLLLSRTSLDGGKLFPRPRLEGDVGTGVKGFGRELRMGEFAREVTEGAGDADLTAGDVGRARCNMFVNEGLTGRGSPPVKRLTTGFVIDVSDLS